MEADNHEWVVTHDHDEEEEDNDHDDDDQQHHHYHITHCDDDDEDEDDDDETMDITVDLTRLLARTNLHTIPSSRLAEMSYEEREAALLELHGVIVETVIETPELIGQKLEELDAQLLFIREKQEQGKAYEEAMRRNPDYVRSWRLSFLRAENFDVGKARRRLLAHFATRLSFFENPEVLGRDITLADLTSEHDKFLLRQGMIQLLPHRDQAGRAIIMMYVYQKALGTVPYDHQSLLRVLFWMSTLAAKQGDEVQRKGMVVVWYGLGAKSSPLHRGRSPLYFDLFVTTNIRTVSVHACYDDSSMTEVFNEIMAKAESDYLFRLQTHHGDHAECQMSLANYGIPLGTLPVNDTEDGTVQLKDHYEMLTKMGGGTCQAENRIMDPDDVIGGLLSSSSATTGNAQTTKATTLFAQSNIHSIPPSRVYETTPEERTEALQDLHGASDTIHEDSSCVKAKLAELDFLLATFDQNVEERAAYDEAMRRNPEYVRKMRLSFLRAENFHTAKAAHRMRLHFTTRLALFATPEVLGRDIGLLDLDSELDKFALKNGMIQLLPHRDRAGRAIIMMYVYQKALGTIPYDQKSLLRILFWMSTLAANQGDEVQKKGMIIVWYGLGARSSPLHTGRSPRYYDLIVTMNIKTISVHACYDDSAITEVFNEIMAKAESKYLFRLQTHYGNHIECRYSLMSYGIPLGILPVNCDSDGTVQLADHEQFLARLEVADRRRLLLSSRRRSIGDTTTTTTSNAADRQQQHQQQHQAIMVGSDHDLSRSSSCSPSTTQPVTDATTTITPTTASSPSPAIILAPGPKDIVLGRGQRGTKFPGNQFLKRLLEERYEEYNKASRPSKRVICEDIYDRMCCEAGCRFLEPSDVDAPKSPIGRSKPPESWVELSRDLAVKRISHKFRNVRSSLSTTTATTTNSVSIQTQQQQQQQQQRWG